MRPSEKSLTVLFVVAAFLLATASVVRADSPTVPEGLQPPEPQEMLLKGDQALAKLVELGFTQGQIREMRQRARQGSASQRFNEPPVSPQDVGGDNQPLSCGVGKGAWTLFETAIGPMVATYISSLGLETPMPDWCNDAFCTYFHSIGGSPDRAYWIHMVQADWADHITWGCN